MEDKAMMMTEVFAKGYKEKAAKDTFQKFTKRCRTFGDGMTQETLKNNDVSNHEIAFEVASGLIKYEPRMGYLGRESGYTLTHDGIKKVFSLMR
jgi:hypothetical protein